VVREGYSAVFDVDLIALTQHRHSVRVEIAQEREIDIGHCNALPQSLFRHGAASLFARCGDGVDIGHACIAWCCVDSGQYVRRDIGAALLKFEQRLRTLTVGYLEVGALPAQEASFDVWVRTAAPNG
jgi:hypothetical protein